MLKTAILAESAINAIGRMSAPCHDHAKTMSRMPQDSCVPRLVLGGVKETSLMLGFVVMTSSYEN